MWFDLLFKNKHVVGHSPVCENVFPFTKTGLDALDSTINFRNTVTWWHIRIIALGFSSSFVNVQDYRRNEKTSEKLTSLS